VSEEWSEEPYQDAYVFLRTTSNVPDALDNPSQVRSKPFDLLTGSYARLYVLKADTLETMSGFLKELSEQDVNKALALSCRPNRIVHMGTFASMGFVQVWVRPGANPCDVLQRISVFRTFKGGVTVQGNYDILVEFGDDLDPPVQADADAVRTVPGVARREVALVVGGP
jgi:hypothetical protein